MLYPAFSVGDHAAQIQILACDIADRCLFDMGKHFPSIWEAKSHRLPPDKLSPRPFACYVYHQWSQSRLRLMSDALSMPPKKILYPRASCVRREGHFLHRVLYRRCRESCRKCSPFSPKTTYNRIEQYFCCPTLGASATCLFRSSQALGLDAILQQGFRCLRSVPGCQDHFREKLF